jgi:transposase
MNGDQKLLAKRLLQEEKSVSEVAKTFNVHKATIYRLLDQGV